MTGPAVDGWDELARGMVRAGGSRFVFLLDVLLELGVTEEAIGVATRNVVRRRETAAQR